MEVQTKTKPALTVLGIEGRGDADKGPEWIKQLWSKAFTHFDEIRDLVESDQEAWGLMSATDEYLAPWKKEGKYLARREVEAGTKPPEGWTIWEVPEQTYAAIACTMITYGEATKLVVQQFLPKEGYEQAGAMHEFHPGAFQDIEKDTLYLYFTIKKTHAQKP
ncbi:MAG: GyrI-like domain-containing protein [Candidatus Bathyarchaeota archaeon]|nr:MAG: GyrI-like domain-containing protein [Candidatus Bathyarchaeota archaeon]